MYKFILMLFLLACTNTNKKCFIVVEEYNRGTYGSLITRVAYPATSEEKAIITAYKLTKDNDLLDSLVKRHYIVERKVYIKECLGDDIQLIERTVIEYDSVE